MRSTERDFQQVLPISGSAVLAKAWIPTAGIFFLKLAQWRGPLLIRGAGELWWVTGTSPGGTLQQVDGGMEQEMLREEGIQPFGVKPGGGGLFRHSRAC